MARGTSKATRTEAALAQAQDLVYAAWEASTAKRRKALAEQALAISPHCADAYVLLAGLAPAARTRSSIFGAGRAVLRENEHVPAYLLDDRRMPKRLPPFMSPGKEDEAIHYAAEFAAGWAKTPGALDWLRERTHEAGRSSRGAPAR